MRLGRIHATLLAGAMAIAAVPAQAQTSPGELGQLSLDDLLNIKVILATKSHEVSVDRAPGVVRVFTRQDIERYGFQTLRDVLVNVPGVQLQEYRAGHEAVWVRGIKQRYNNKILWLVDGVPIRDAYYGHQGIDEAVPLGMVERIEIVTGPGGVLYGTNAFAGVVSIVTKSGAIPRDARSGRVSFGTFETTEQGVEFGSSHLYAFADHLDTDGFQPALNSDGKAFRHEPGRERTYGLVKLDAGDIQGAFNVVNHQYADTYRKSGRDRTFDRDPMFGSVRFSKDFASSINLHALGYYEYYPLVRTEVGRSISGGPITSVKEETFNTSLMGTDVDVSVSRGRHEAIVGASFQADRSLTMQFRQALPATSPSNELVVPRVSRRDAGLFAQDVWSFTPDVALTTGIRYDALSAFDNEFSYRTALTGRAHQWYGKALFGTAFRVPSYREYLDVTSYNLSLRPEHLQTLELQAGRRFARGDLNVTFYNNAYRDLIREIFVARIDTPTGVRVVDDEYSINAKRSTIRGVELFAQAAPIEPLTVTVGLSRLLSATETIGALDPTIVPSVVVTPERADVLFFGKSTANVLVDYRLDTRGDRVGLNLTGTSKRQVPADYQSAVPAANRNPSNADGHVRVDAFSTVRLTNRLHLKMRGVNLFDRRIYSPPFDNETGYDAQWASRSVRAELVFRY